MADFEKAIGKVLQHEGGYANVKGDAGGETFMGISRKYNPSWTIWKLIDEVKKKNGTKHLNSLLCKNKDIINAVHRLYKEKYWDVLELDDVPNQKIANEMFDTCVNCGKVTAIRVAQQTIGMTITGKWSDELRYNLLQYGEDK